MSLYRRGRVYWMHIRFRGKEIYKTTKATDKQTARDFAAAYRVNLIRGMVDLPPTGEEVRDPTISELIDALEADWKLEAELTPRDRSNFKMARSCFPKNPKARELTKGDVDQYISKRQKEGAAPATINRTLLLIKQAFKLAKTTPPEIRHLSEKGNVRKGFFTREEFDRVYSNLPADLRDFALFCFLTAWRKGEAASLTWGDIEGDTIRLRGENSKNGEPRSIEIAGELPALIERRKQARLSDGVLTNFLFHREGRPIAEFRKAWASACKKAGLEGRLFHDLRRSGVRIMVRSGVAQSIAMKISGHRTASMFRRYDITDSADLRAAMESVERYHKAEAAKVVSIAQ